MSDNHQPVDKRFYHLIFSSWPGFLLGLCLALFIGFLLMQKDLGQWGENKNQRKELFSLLGNIEKTEEANTNLAFKQAQRIVELADSLEDTMASIEGNYWLGKTALIGNKFNENGIISLAYLRISHELIAPLKNPYWKAQILNQMASTFMYLGEIDSAELYWNKGLDQSKLVNKSKEDSLMILAGLLKIKSVIIEQSAAKKEESPLDIFSKASIPLYQSYSIYKSLNSLEGQGICLRNLGILYTNIDSFEKAQINLNEARKINKEMGSNIAEHETLREMGKSYIAQFVKDQLQEDFQNGISAYVKALSLENTEQANTLLHIGLGYHTALYYLKLSKNKQNKYLDSAIYYYQRGIDSAQFENNLFVIEYITSSLANICEYHPMRDDCKGILRKVNNAYSHLASSTKEAQANAEKNYQTFRQRTILKQANQRRSRLLLSVGLVLLIVVTSFLFFYDKLQVESLKKQLASKQIALQAQMNPHFISNSLNAIESLINLNENRKASSYLVQFSDLARIVLQHSQEEFIPLAEELKMLNHYLELEKLRMTDKLNFNIQIDSELDVNQTGIPPMMIQPLVENAVWHGIKPKTSPGNISIQFQKEADGLLMCIVEDDGIGRAKSIELQQQSAFPRISHSTRIIEERIDVLKSQKGADLRITDLTDEKGNPSGTKAEMFIHFTDLLPTEYEIT